MEFEAYGYLTLGNCQIALKVLCQFVIVAYKCVHFIRSSTLNIIKILTIDILKDKKEKSCFNFSEIEHLDCLSMSFTHFKTVIHF